MIKNSIFELIGETPTIKYTTINNNDIYIKLEGFNIGGSIKDRVAKAIIDKWQEEGKLTPGVRVVESTSGNTGIALAMLLASLNIPLTITMPENMSKERIALMKAYGANVLLTPKELGMQGAIDKALELKEQGYLYADQFHNEANRLAHEKTTAKEIEADFNDTLDYIVVGVGTAGTISGISKALKGKHKNLKIIAVEPSESATLSLGQKGIHAIQGIGAGFVPPLYDANDVDEIICVPSLEATNLAKELAHRGLLLGISSAAALVAAIKIARQTENKKIVCISPDNGMKYISSGIYE